MRMIISQSDERLRAFSITYRYVAQLNSDRHSLLSVVVVLRHRDDNIALFAPGFDVSMRLGGLFKRIAPINDRLDLSGLNKILEEDEVCLLCVC